MSDEYWNEIKQAYEDVSIYDGANVFLSAFRDLQPHVGDLLATHWILSEVSNGGFAQFFQNDTGVLAPEAAQGFSRMELPEVGELVRRAMACFGKTYPRERKEREKFLASQADLSFEQIERRLYEIGTPNLGKIYDAMDDYAIRNAG